MLKEVLHKLEEENLEVLKVHQPGHVNITYVELQGDLCLKIISKHSLKLLTKDGGTMMRTLLWPTDYNKSNYGNSNCLDNNRTVYNDNFDDFKELLDVIKRMCN